MGVVKQDMSGIAEDEGLRGVTEVPTSNGAVVKPTTIVKVNMLPSSQIVLVHNTHKHILYKH